VIFWTTEHGPGRMFYPDAGYTPFRGTTKGNGAVREAIGPPPLLGAREDRCRRQNTNILGGFDLDGPLPSLQGCPLPNRRPARGRTDQTFDSYEHVSGVAGQRSVERKSWFSSPRANSTSQCGRVNINKAVFNLRVTMANDWSPWRGLQPSLEGGRELCRGGCPSLFLT